MTYDIVRAALPYDPCRLEALDATSDGIGDTPSNREDWLPSIRLLTTKGSSGDSFGWLSLLTFFCIHPATTNKKYIEYEKLHRMRKTYRPPTLRSGTRCKVRR